MPDLTIDEATRAALAPYGFSEEQLAHFATRAATADSNAVRGALTPPGEGDVTPLPALGSPARRELAALGEAAIARGEVGAVILAGGMATRFGGVVKAVVPVLGDKSFLELKHDDVLTQAARVGATIPCFVMSSFATHERILQHVEDRGLGGKASAPIRVFPQLVSLRLTPSGELFRDAEGELSPYATGHGDLSFALRASGVLRDFRAAGGKLLVMSNVDNLGASLDPAIVGFHLQHGQAITAEVVPKNPGDKGGAPARLDGVPQIIEGFRFPEAFDQDSITVFNTNTFVLDAAAIDRDFDLPFYRVEKQVDGQTAIQFERLVGELTAFLSTRFVEVGREGEDGRFLPAKDPDELARRLPMIQAITEARRGSA
ncbi:MAG: UTP--glucose-1-phosphate uridylyltransferase [Myxococcales bacterium]|nr:UTP--glucose-1-phosphate uridylyltransferase [Myxococcales bacterium]